MASRLFKKAIIVSTCAILLAGVLVILFASPLTKYLVEKFDEKYTGRQITIGRAYVNPFTGYIHFHDFRVYESENTYTTGNPDRIFFSAKSVQLNIALLKLLFKTYEITELALDEPRGFIIQNKKHFNFDDLVELFSGKTVSDTTQRPARINILNITISNGEFTFREETIPIHYFIKNVHVKSTGKRWNSDTLSGSFSFESGIGSGDLKATFAINLKKETYQYAVVIHNYNLNIIGQYLKDMMNYGTFSAHLDADLIVSGNFNNEEDMNASGKLAVNDFHFGKNPQDDYAAFDKLAISIFDLNPKNRKYLFDSVTLIHPYFKYELYDHLDNLETMFGIAGSNIYAVDADPARFNLVIEIARYVKTISRNFFQSYYNINHLSVTNGDLKFNDYSITEKFSIGLSPLNITADSIDKNNDRVNVSIASDIQPFGQVTVRVSINPKDSADFDMHYRFQRIPVALLNPYTISYTSFPLDRGTVEIHGMWNVRKGIIQSDNHLVVLDPRPTKRIRNKDNHWIPLPLIMSFVRARGNVIDYQIPITGNLQDPKFHLHDAFVDLFENIFVKPATTPYRMEVKNAEMDIEKALTLQWQMRQKTLRPNQVKFIERMVDFLSKHPDASIAVYPQHYAAKEMEYILFYEAKKYYYLANQQIDAGSFGESDSDKVNKMSIRDTLFEAYINRQVNDSMLFTIQDKCIRLVGSKLIHARFKQLNNDREQVFMQYFRENNVEKQLNLYSEINTIPYNGFSFYKLSYTGEFPKHLIKAYRKMNELNNESPRKKYQEDRKVNPGPQQLSRNTGSPMP